jgi:hypothetical protein
MISANDLFVITVRLKAKEVHCMATILFYILQKSYQNKSCICFNGLLPYIISGPYIKLCYCCYHLTSLCTCHVTTNCRNIKKYKVGMVSLMIWYRVCENWLNGSKVEGGRDHMQISWWSHKPTFFPSKICSLIQTWRIADVGRWLWCLSGHQPNSWRAGEDQKLSAYWAAVFILIAKECNMFWCASSLKHNCGLTTNLSAFQTTWIAI